MTQQETNLDKSLQDTTRRNKTRQDTTRRHDKHNKTQQDTTRHETLQIVYVPCPVLYDLLFWIKLHVHL